MLFRSLDQDDAAAEVEGWARQVSDRTFHLRHDEFRIEHFDGYDYDIGMVRVAEATVTGERAMIELLKDWQLPPGELDYLWNTDHP